MNHLSTTTFEDVMVDDNQLELVSDRFTRVEASILIDSIIDELKSLYKRRYLKAWEHNHDTSKEALNRKIELLDRLKAEKKSALQQAVSDTEELELSTVLNLQKVAS